MHLYQIALAAVGILALYVAYRLCCYPCGCGFFMACKFHNAEYERIDNELEREGK
jgi:hypothetical protein